MTFANPYVDAQQQNAAQANAAFPQYNQSNAACNGNHDHAHNHSHAHNHAQPHDHQNCNGHHPHAQGQLSDMYYTNREKFLKNQNSTSSTRSKRRNSESEDAFKKVKQITEAQNSIPTDQLTLENINLDEYAQFNHPDGGIIQFTPIGNIRTYVTANNTIQRTIEQNSAFDLNKTDRGIDGYRLYLGKDIDLSASPSNEIEGYMRSGYNAHGSGNCGCCQDDYDCDSDLEDDDDYYHPNYMH